MSIYKACDIRGVYPSSLDERTSNEIGAALGTMLGPVSVLVAGDVRVSTPALKESLINGLVDAGCEVVDIGMAPTPAFYYALSRLGTESGVTVTASHNPAKYNGFKIAPHGQPMTEDVMDELRKIVEAGVFAHGSRGRVRKAEILEDYKAFVLEAIGELVGKQRGAKPNGKPLKAVVDCGNGCYSTIAPEVLRRADIVVEELYCWEDGAFPNREPNPAVAANLDALCGNVRQTGADFGIAFDGDGDRVVFVDESGNVVPSDNAIALFAGFLLRKHPGSKVVFDIKCSSLVADSVKAAGGVPVMEKSGHAYIKNNLLRSGAVFAGEISGHFFFSALKGDDGLFAALLMAEMIKADGRSLGKMVEAQPKYFTTKDFRIPFSGSTAELFSRLKARLEVEGGARLSFLDGIRAEFADGWGLIRASVTEPLVTLRFEGKSLKSLDGIRESFLAGDSVLLDAVREAWEGHLP